MATLEDIKALAATLRTDEQALTAIVRTLHGNADQVAALTAQVADLKAQVAAGTPVTQADLDSAAATLSAIDADIKSVLPVPAPAPVAPAA